MSSSIANVPTYTTTLGFEINAFVSTQISRNTVLNSLFGIPVEGNAPLNTQSLILQPGSAQTINNVSNVFGVFSNAPLNLTISQQGSTNVIDAAITNFTILEGQFSSVVITNSATASSSASITVIYS
jgi:hypothetical protein